MAAGWSPVKVSMACRRKWVGASWATLIALQGLRMATGHQARSACFAARMAASRAVLASFHTQTSTQCRQTSLQCCHRGPYWSLKGSHCQPLQTIPCLFTAAAEEMDHPAARLVAASAQQLFHQARNALKAQAAAGQEDSSSDSPLDTLEDREDEISHVGGDTKSPAVDPVQSDPKGGDDARVASNLAGLLIAAAFPEEWHRSGLAATGASAIDLRVEDASCWQETALALQKSDEKLLCHATHQLSTKNKRFQRTFRAEAGTKPAALSHVIAPAIW